MGKLNIAHHKSYHPYRRDNIDRVRKDEEEARIKEAQEEGRIMLADAEARIALLRQRAGVDKKSSKRSEEKDQDRKLLQATQAGTRDYLATAQLPTTDGHINLFQDLEKNELAETIKTTTAKKVSSSSSATTDKGIALAPSEKDLNPWYSNKKKEGVVVVVDDDSHHDKINDSEINDSKRQREIARKTIHDPLTSINHHLSLKKPEDTNDHQDRRFKRPFPPPPQASTSQHAARLARESSERERAQALIRRKKREMTGSETPITDTDRGYGDIFNKKEVDDARRERERERDRRENRYWDHDYSRSRSHKN